MLSGIIAEFDSPERLVRAYERLQRAGYTQLRTWTPYPVHEVLRSRRGSVVGWVMLSAGAFGGLLAYLVQWWCNAWDYPLNVGGRPLHSVPAFIPIAFETTVLFAAVSGFFVTLGVLGLPRLHHPLFEVAGFERATIDRFWIGVDASDPLFGDGVSAELSELGALRCERLESTG